MQRLDQVDFEEFRAFFAPVNVNPEEILRIFSWPCVEGHETLEKTQTLELFRSWIRGQLKNVLKKFLIAIAGVDGIKENLSLTVLMHQS